MPKDPLQSEDVASAHDEMRGKDVPEVVDADAWEFGSPQRAAE